MVENSLQEKKAQSFHCFQQNNIFWIYLTLFVKISSYSKLYQLNQEKINMETQLDDVDRKLLNYLQENARITNAELSRRVELSPPGLQKRVRKLEDAGIIDQYATILNPEKVGYDMLCFVQITLGRHKSEFLKNFMDVLQEIPEVLEAYLRNVRLDLYTRAKNVIMEVEK